MRKHANNPDRIRKFINGICGFFIVVSLLVSIITIFKFYIFLIPTSYDEKYISIPKLFSNTEGVYLAKEDDDKTMQAQMDFTLTKVERDESTVTLNIDIYIPKAFLETLIGQGNNDESIYATKDSSGQSTFSLKEMYQSSSFTIKFINVYAYGAKSIYSVPIPLKELVEVVPKTFVYSASDIRFPLIGQSEVFPHDWYVLNEFVSIELPSSPDRSMSSRLDGDRYSFYVPFSIKVALGGGSISNFDIYANKIEDNTGATKRLRLDIRTDIWIRVYTYTILISFLAIAAALGSWTIIRSIHSDGSSWWEIITACGTTAIAVLPVREVIVPEGLPHLTLTDAWLSLALVMLVNAVLWAGGRAALTDQEPSRRGGQQSGNEGAALVD